MMMTSSSEYEGEELEAMRPSDSSWHPCKVYLSPFGNFLFINYGSREPEDMVVTEVEALERLRFRSNPLAGDDCARIDQGEHVLVAHQSVSESSHYDATVKKVLRVRHSKRNNCNCTFVIEFLGRKGEHINVTSDSIMRIHKKNVKLHPVVCEFLKIVKSLRESTASPFVKVDHVTDTNEGLNGASEDHIKGGYNVADLSKNDITTFNDLGLEVDGKVPLQRRLIDAFNLDDRRVQVSGDMENQKIMLQRTETLQLDMDTEYTIPSVPSISELPKNRFRLSPLGARAALASLVSTIHAPMANDAKLLAPSILIHTSIIDGKVSEVSSKSKSSYFRADVAHSITEGKLPDPGNSGRITRSAARKLSKSPEDDSSIAKDVKRSSRRSTRSSGLEQDIEASSRKSTSASCLEQHIEIGKKESEATDLVQPKVMVSRARKDNNFSQVEEDIDGYCLFEQISEVCCAPSSVASEFVEAKSSMASAAVEVNKPVATKRLTRSAARSENNSENCTVGLPSESSAISRRCTRSSGLGRSESMVARDQGSEDRDLVQNTGQQSNAKYASQRKERLPLQDDCKTSRASDKHGENKTDGIDNHGQGKTASAIGRNLGQKRKAACLSSLAAERRFSPRLRNIYQG